LDRGSIRHLPERNGRPRYMSKDQLDYLHNRVFPEMLALKKKARKRMGLSMDDHFPQASNF
jgi:hypothetical protein